MSAPLLSVKNLRVAFDTPLGFVQAVDQVSFEVDEGETLGLVGESGSGKSVTVLAVLGLVPRPAGRVESGEAWYGGENLLALPEKRLAKLRGKELAMVFQDPTTSLNPFLTVGRQITEVLEVHAALSAREAREAAARALGDVGIASPETRLEQYPHELSGGQRQRVMIAMALVVNPRIVFADEPTTALDVTVQAQILDLLRSIQHSHGTAIVLITHDLGVVAGMADRVHVMYAGRLVETAPTDELFVRPLHPYTAGLLASVPTLAHDPAQPLPSIQGHPPDSGSPTDGCAFAPRCALAIDRCRRQRPTFDVVPPRPDRGRALALGGRKSACFEVARLRDAPGPDDPEAGDTVTGEPPGEVGAVTGPLLVVEDLTKVYPVGRRRLFGRPRGTLRAVDRVSFAIEPGSALGLVGESGCGKSTTARLLVGLEEPTEGSIRLDGFELCGRSARERLPYRRRVQMIFQNPFGALDPRQTLGQILAEPLAIHGLGTRHERLARALGLLEAVGLTSRHLNRYPHELSGGQRQRVVIARALALEPDLIVCDEPVSALDVSIQAQIVNLLKDLRERFGLAYLFIAHDLAIVREVCDRICVMYLGRIVEEATRDELFSAPEHPYTRALLSAIPIPDPVAERARRRVPIAGDVASPVDPPSGCAFHPRCPDKERVDGERCAREVPRLEAPSADASRRVACHLVEERRSGGSDAVRPAAAPGNTAHGRP